MLAQIHPGGQLLRDARMQQYTVPVGKPWSSWQDGRMAGWQDGLAPSGIGALGGSPPCGCFTPTGDGQAHASTPKPPAVPGKGSAAGRSRQPALFDSSRAPRANQRPRMG